MATTTQRLFSHTLLLNAAGLQFVREGRRPAKFPEELRALEEHQWPAWDENPASWNAPWRWDSLQGPFQPGELSFGVELDENDSTVRIIPKGNQVDDAVVFIRHLLAAMADDAEVIFTWAEIENNPEAETKYSGGVALITRTGCVLRDAHRVGCDLAKDSEGNALWNVVTTSPDYDDAGNIIGTDVNVYNVRGSKDRAYGKALQAMVEWTEGDWSAYEDDDRFIEFQEAVAHREFDSAIALWNDMSVMQISLVEGTDDEHPLSENVDMNFPTSDEDDEDSDSDGNDEDAEDDGDQNEDDGNEEENEQET